MKRIAIILATLCLALFPSMHQAAAGGWATIAFVVPLESVTIGDETTIEFRVLAHNNPETPMTGMRTSFLLTHKDTGYFVAVDGVATSDPEVYTITFMVAWEGELDLRAMIHNYLPDGPILWTSPDPVTATAAT
jgi:hypothetical protein